MAAPIVTVKNKEEQGITMATYTTYEQIPTSAYGQSESKRKLWLQGLKMGELQTVSSSVMIQ